MTSTTLPSTMRAAQWSSSAGGLERNLKATSNASLPKGADSLPKDSTLVHIEYASLNLIDAKFAELPIISRLALSKPATPGLDFAGKVVSTQLSHLKPGELIFGKSEIPAFGALAEYIIVGKDGLVPLPDGVSTQQGSAIGSAGLAAYQSIIPYVKPGSKVFINGGSGGVGTFGIQIAKAAGCYVTATCSGANVELCKSLGADEVIDYRSQSVVDTLKRSGKQYDLIVDYAFANPKIYWQSHHYLKPEGRFITIVADANLYTVSTFLQIFLIPSFLGGGKRKFQFLACKSNPEHLAQIGKWITEGKVKPVIEEVFELDAASEAYARLKTGRTKGKLVVKVAGN